MKMKRCPVCGMECENKYHCFYCGTVFDDKSDSIVLNEKLTTNNNDMFRFENNVVLKNTTLDTTIYDIDYDEKAVKKEKQKVIFNKVSQCLLIYNISLPLFVLICYILDKLFP